ncbi:hypothetical protein ACTJIJ_22965 [Niabella sp. 22666]|uniref:hypothetical protein n=1 Tax=Niabella sp. 22666 TaxID=3453954 RepID=UPI003F82C369
MGARLTKKETEMKKARAFRLYMAGEEQKTIADLEAVSEKTVSKWVTEGNWKNKRSAATITRDELVNKALSAISTMMDNFLQAEEKDFTGFSDSLNKMAATVERLDRKDNVVLDMEAAQRINKHALKLMAFDKEITPDFMRLMNKVQQSYINSRLSTSE